MSIRFVSRGPPDQVSGGYLYNQYLIDQLRRNGVDVAYHGCVSELDELDSSDILVVDSLVIGETAERLLSISAQLVLLLHVLPASSELGCHGDAIFSSLCHRARLIVTGDCTLESLGGISFDGAVDAVKIEPGVPEHWRAKACYAQKACRLLGVANYIRGKGIDRALDVLRRLKDLPWTLTIHGNRDLDPHYFAAMAERSKQYGLDDRVELLGTVPHDAINEKMLGSDLLVHLSEHESYSMATAEAIACGLPVLSHRTGNADAFRKSGLVRYVADCRSAVRVLGALIDNEDAYGRLRLTGSWARRTWQDVGQEFIAWLGRT